MSAPRALWARFVAVWVCDVEVSSRLAVADVEASVGPGVGFRLDGELLFRGREGGV